MDLMEMHFWWITENLTVCLTPLVSGCWEIPAMVTLIEIEVQREERK